MATELQIHNVKEEIRRAVERYVDEETGEIDGKGLPELEKLEVEFEEAVEGVALIQRELIVTSEAIKAEADRLAGMAKAIEQRAFSLKVRLGQQIGVGNKVKTPKVSIYWSKRSSIEIDDESTLPHWALKTSIRSDKKKLDQVLDVGTQDEKAEIEGNVRRVTKHHVVIR